MMNDLAEHGPLVAIDIWDSPILVGEIWKVDRLCLDKLFEVLVEKHLWIARPIIACLYAVSEKTVRCMIWWLPP